MEVVLKKSGAKVLIDTEDLHFCKALQRGRDGLVYSRWWEKKKQVRVGLHRLIMNAPKGLTVDHINGNTLDNTRQNLEVISREISKRRAKKKTSANIYRGVTKMSKNKWRADIKNNFIGSFDTPEEAAKAWNKFALEFYGNDAQLNEV